MSCRLQTHDIKHRTWRLWIPALVNLAINLTAFFSPIAFSYDQNYNFVRGPLGYSVFIVGMSLDMNGLKHINDTQGHTEGDRALAEIGRCLGRADSRNTIAYRIGGDEFLIVFLQQDKAAVEKTIARVREDVTRAGYSVSVGCAMRTGSESTDDLLHESDRKMYEDKAAYYRQSGMDRRRN